MRILPGQQYYGIINFIADDDSHGFVTLFEDILEVDISYAFDKSNTSLVFYPSTDESYQRFQIVKIEVQKEISGKKEVAEIIQTNFFGLKAGKYFIPIDELFRGPNYKLELSGGENDLYNKGDGEIFNLRLRYGKRSEKLEFTSSSQPLNEDIRFHKLKLEFFYFLNLRSFLGLRRAEFLLPNLLETSTGTSFVNQQARDLMNFLKKNGSKQLKKYFLKVFGNLDLEMLDKSSVFHLAGPNGADLLNLWINDEVPASIITIRDLISFHRSFKIFNNIPGEILNRILSKVQEASNFKDLLEVVLQGRPIISDEEVNFLLDYIAAAGINSSLTDLLIEQLKTETAVKLWREEKVRRLPTQKLAEYYQFFTDEDRIKLLQQVGWDSYLKACGKNTESSREIIENYFEHFKDHIKKEINYCCFDLEVDPHTQKIEELAFRNNKEIFEELDPTADDIRQLKNALEGADVVIGQNIREFDLEKLYGDEMPELVIWDSLEIEAILRPDAHSLALNTEHYALDDVEHTLSLFYYQLYRILGDDSLRKSIKDLYNFHFLEDDQVAAIPYLKIKHVAIEKPVKKLFHSEVSGINKVVRTMVPKTARLVICPEPFWPHFRDDANYHFEGENHLYSLSLERAKWEEKLADFAFLKACLNQFHKSCETKRYNPYARLLSSYLVQLIQEHFPIEQICTSLKPLGKKSIVSEWDFGKNSEALLEGRSEKEVVQLGSDLWPFTSKRNFGEFTQHELSVTEEGNALWVRFSNGRSYAPISEILAKGLANEVSGDHFWIERESLAKYILWGSNAGVLDERFTRVKAGDYYTKDSGLGAKDARFIKYSNNASSRLMDLNPETLYRDKYWDVKLKTLIQLLGSGRLEKDKCVLIVSRPEEVDTLTKIIRKLGGWFSPSLKSNLRRRLERLVEEEKGIMIVAQEDFEQLLSYPLSEGILYVIESLSPEELVEISGINRENELTASIEDEEGDTESEGMELPHLSSVAGSMNRLNKYYDWMMFRMALQHQQNELLLMDPRANSSLFDSFKCKALPVDFKEIIEGKSRVFEIITELTSSWLYAPRVFEYGNLQEHLDRISAALIDGYSFKPEQRDYLDIIFPAKDDVLVTLPTGVGKSVLFQGPALYRSSFTGKMSIVVTPLKALMEDHVMGLWKKGFWNGVEYINADKGAEVKDIYRKIAGGQLLMVFVTPERFRSKGFVRALEQRMKIDGGLEYFIFDEAHCISQWGSEFRPDYFYCAQQIKQIRKTYPAPLLLLSATVTKQVASHLEHALYEEV